jgi:hypothetical protein
MERGGTAPHIVNFGTRRDSVTLHAPAALNPITYPVILTEQQV